AFTKIQLRRDNRNNWASSTSIPAEGELCYESTINAVKFGDGTSRFNQLPYFTGLGIVSVEVAINGSGEPVFSLFRANSIDMSSSDVDMELESTGVYAIYLPIDIMSNYFIVPIVELAYDNSESGMLTAADYTNGTVYVASTTNAGV